MMRLVVGRIRRKQRKNLRLSMHIIHYAYQAALKRGR